MRERGGAALPVLVLLVALLGAGGYNYWRNLQAEEAIPRPYRSYSDRDLAALHEAHRQEAAALDARYQARPQTQNVRGGGFIDQQIQQFEKIHREGRAKRQLGGEVASHESVVRNIEAEQALRTRDASELAVHWRRLSSF